MKLEYEQSVKITTYFSAEELKALYLTQSLLQELMESSDDKKFNVLSLWDGSELHVSDLDSAYNVLTDVISLHEHEHEAW